MGPQLDAVVIGTGFGGAVAACRLVQAGFHICVLERGRRYEKDDFPRVTPPGPGEVPDLSRLLWTAGNGLWELRDLNGIEVGQAAGYGGGSLIYANVHLRAPKHVFESGWPEGCSRDRLERYYDLAAYMLQVASIEAQEFRRGGAPKTAIMQAVAKRLGREGEFFHPPLAVHFKKPREAQEPDGGPRRRTQEGCQGCGNCDIGCEFRAKNTLDLNYLAIAEDAWDDQAKRPYADIRTLAEVVEIKPLDPHHPEHGYSVAYEDRLCGARRVTVEAKWVFLCAGAVNSTELLLKCKASGALPHLSGKLGHKYFANADAVGLAYDVKQPVEPCSGPTITTSLLYHRNGNPAHDRPEWFLLQDGGYPPSLKEVFGMFRAPIWFGRNRYLERAPHRQYLQLAQQLKAFLADEGGIARDRTARVRELLHHFNTGARAMPRSSNRSWVRALSAGHGNSRQHDGHSFRFVSHADGGLGQEHTVSIPADVGSVLTSLEQYVPSQLKQIFQDFRSELSDLLTNELREEARNISEAVLAALEPKGILGSLLHPLVRMAVPARKLHRLTEEETKRALKKRFLLDKLGGVDALVGFIVFLLGFEDPGENTAVFLVMGRDDKPGRLALERGVLCAHFTDPPGHPVYTAEERLMRDYAAELDGPPLDGSGGERVGSQLRVNPAWSFLNRPITVHSQGGCPMGGDAAHGVTDQWGGVHDYEGLHVIDASIFPRSVGVNPSATIAAIAERSIEYRISRELGVDWQADEWDAAQGWATKNRGMLDPIARIEEGHPPAGVPEPRAAPVSLEFDEVMQGFVAEVARNVSYERAEELGRFANTSVVVSLHARSGDLSKMLQDRLHEIDLTGKITVKWPLKPGAPRKAPRPETYDVTGRLRLLVLGGPIDSARERFMIYHLVFGTDGEYVLRGFKRLLDRAGSDAWQDTTTLFTTIRNRRDRSFRRAGILRVGIDDFLTKQMPSFEVRGTDDDERKIWAFGAFASFFFGNLEKVYLPEIDRLRPFP